jgi:outer membrane protein assembly factor BamB
MIDQKPRVQRQLETRQEIRERACKNVLQNVQSSQSQKTPYAKIELEPMSVSVYMRTKQFLLPLSLSLVSTLGFLPSGISTGNARADWPEFRGPSQNGMLPEANVPLEWSESKNVEWYTPTSGLGWSSPVIVDGRIYFTSAINAKSERTAELGGPQQLVLICLDAASGKKVFEKTIFEQPANAPTIHKKNSHASPTPLFHKGKLYLHYGHQGTACTDLNGEIVWSTREHAYPPTHGNGGSPIIVRDTLVFTCDGGETPYTVALDLTSGQERWRTPRGIKADRPFSFCTPQLIDVNGKQQIISPGSDIVQSLDPSNGQVIWSVSYSGFSVVPRPLYYGGLVYLSTGFMRPNLLAIDPTGTGDVTKSHLKWTYKGSVPNTPSFVAYRDEIILASDDGFAASVNAKTGEEKWRKRVSGGISASLTLVGDKLFLQSESGEAIVYRVGSELEELHRNVLPGRIFASYAIHENDWIIRSETGVYRIGNR